MSKRLRGKNFLEEEKDYLIKLVQKRAIIDNKNTDSVTSREKRDAWAAVTNEFNACAKTGLRNPYQLKGLYEKIRKKLSDEKMERSPNQIGGGSKPSGGSPTTTSGAMILGPALTSLVNKFDSNKVPRVGENVKLEPLEIVEFSSSSASTSSYELPLTRECEVTKLDNQNSCQCVINENQAKEIFKMKKEKHDKKMEILEIIRKKELEDLRGKELDNMIKMKVLNSS